MTRSARYVNIAAVVVPFLCVIGAIALFWNDGVSALDLAILVALYLPTGFGITVGYHRLLTHRAFETYKPLRYMWAILGSLALEGPVIAWVADHRKHHAFTDMEGDPHSPHGHGEGVAGVFKGLFHAHVGWLWHDHGRADWNRYAKDLMEDPGMKRINKLFPLWAFLTYAIPFALGYLFGGTLTAALTALLWGGFVRVFMVHHVTWSINSICHVFGSRRFAVDESDLSTNVAWLAIPSMGEAWHHNHHAFPRSAYHGLKWYEIDPSGLLITGMEKAHLAWNVTRIAPERQEARLVENGAKPVSRPRVADPAVGAPAAESAERERETASV
ncbi:acyl-CoA desaturase [Svornostia abyssi]|uniref:Acyl-CoA desaturase n=1 Tax=Svornostia abyssi TaxID=2898438 RepID=A0ABY5PM91_9ACTN|nr:acyl-CoA desaturase [Parviterribacteraceae bacterium J379]